jgi:diacylglycerol kinase family enzyme
LTGLLIVNTRAGNREAGELLEAAGGLGIETHVLGEREDVAQAAQAADAAVIGIAGGDGSTAAVASVAVERSLPLVVVPFGTRNHFARDLGLDDPIAALAAFSGGGGGERRVDVGYANDRLFLNNVSLGLYARLVHRRERHRHRRDALARARALGTLLRHRRDRIAVDGRPVEARVVLVSNNAYELSLLSIGTRERLDEGRLHLYEARALLRPSWVDRSCTTLTVDAAAGSLRAAVDGEPEVLETPVEFRIAPGALRVLLPEPKGGE